jgi:hypothetical protein
MNLLALARPIALAALCAALLATVSRGEEKARLRYRFAAGEEFRVKVTHLAAVDTRIRGVSEKTKTRAVSNKVWQIEDVDDDGNIRFVYKVENVSMWQQVSGREEVRYDSRQDDSPPPEYQPLAETVGVPLATVTISPQGRILDRENMRPQVSSTIGDLTIHLPESPVAVGQQWSREEEIPIRRPDMRVKRIKTRELYTLESLKTGVATISVRTQILTPIDDPQIQSQLVQRIKRGEIKFDVDAGRPMSQQMDVDETVIGFNGPDSMMKYLSRLTEEVLPQESVAGGPAQPVN